MVRLFAILFSVLSCAAYAADDWVEISNSYTDKALEVAAENSPEFAAFFGVEGYDDKIGDPSLAAEKKHIKRVKALIKELQRALASEEHPKVRQDLEILIGAHEDELETIAINRRNLLTYTHPAENIFGALQPLLDPQNDASRRPAALVRLKKYAGLEGGTKPMTERIKARIEQDFKNDKLVGPFINEVETHLGNWQEFGPGIAELFKAVEIEGYEDALAALEEQFAAFYAWVESDLKPRARTQSQLPVEVYQNNLKQYGVYATPDELIDMGTFGFNELRSEMQAVANLIAAERGFEDSDYRAVVAKLKEEQIDGAKILDYFRDINAKLEAIIREQDLATIPDRPTGIEIGSKAETAAQPAPHVRLPQLIGNTGQVPVFVVPYLEPDADGNYAQNDDLVPAGAWTLMAHEARPGHEMQFSSMIEQGVSRARVVYAFNSANAEGWGLYSEAITKPYMPLEGQLMSLRWRLARAARIMLDPMINTGRISVADAKTFLMAEVGHSDAFAQQEVDRYSFRAPGQATSYYFGYASLRRIRVEAELALKGKFNARAFHDFILAQGLLPPDLMRKAVLEDFVPSQL